MDKKRYVRVPTHLEFVENEHEMLAFWADQGVFQRSVEANRNGPRWTVYEGPPTANGTPGTHHIEARTFKDILPRFRTMQGFHVERRAGWDCHGLPVELAVEKELQLDGKQDIEAYGVAEFNEKCRESVMRHVEEWRELTDRMGYWVDLDNAYKTMDTPYVESVWWSLKQIFNKGLLQQDFRVAPYCPRCGTTLSDHELAQGYEEDVDPSVYVRFVVTSGPYAGAALLVWTTTPWTLVVNTAVAVNADMRYVVASNGEERIILAEAAAGVLDDSWEAEHELTGSEMAGWSYTPPFDYIDFPVDSPVHHVVTAPYVTSSDGTGIVHIAPAFGAEDLGVARAFSLPVVNPIDTKGRFEATLPVVGGLFFKEADAPLIAKLSASNHLFKRVDITHQYPHCWRCHTHLIYYALPAWYIRTTEVKDELLSANESTSWHPATLKYGRYGNWLNQNVDWTLSRARYWGTPLPIWVNDTTNSTMVVESLAELGHLARRDLSELDPHRPFIDAVTFTIPGEAGTYRRVPDVIDAWYDSGAMPFAQWGYPHVDGSVERFNSAFPANFICEAIDQTRGWFYSLMAVGTLIFNRSSYESVISLGHILAEDGRKMSKHLGNIVLPLPLMDRHTADAVRWFMACSGSPWSARLVGPAILDDIARKVIHPLWNITSFLSLYASAADWGPDDQGPPVNSRNDLDRWILSEVNRLIVGVTHDLDMFDTQEAGSKLTAFLDVLSNWYVRRSRRRFWSGEPTAFHTLHDVLRTVTLLMAPFVPFVTERVWQSMFVPTSESETASVHLARWPRADEALIDDALNDQMMIARRVVELGRTARQRAGIAVRQPLRRLLVTGRTLDSLSQDLCNEIADELNVHSIESFESAGEFTTLRVSPNFRSLGKRYGAETPRVAEAIRRADARELSRTLKSTGVATVRIGTEELVVVPEDITVTEQPRDEWALGQDGSETVALDLEIDDALRRAGVAREITRFIQETRKQVGLEISDRIRLRWFGSDEVLAVLSFHADSISKEVLAIDTAIAPDASGFRHPEFDFIIDLDRMSDR